MYGLTYQISDAFRLKGLHVIDIGYDYIAKLFTNRYTSEFRPSDEVIVWLDDNTPGWELCSVKVITEFWFKTKEDAMLFKLTWA
jgi:hypothetical protein